MQLGCHLPTQGPIATREALFTFCRRAEEQQIGAENDLALAYAGYGRLQQQQGDTTQTRTYLTRALAIFERLGTLHEPGRIRQLLALQEGVC